MKDKQNNHKMKREIKFRAWENDRKIMCYGYETYISDAEKNNYPLMQFTGLKDKNGNEIFEGDILKSEFVNCNFAIEWNNDVACYDWYVLTESKKEGASLAKSIEEAPVKAKKPFCKIVEIIGNIYETPDLLSERS
jgi:uncharacterized phage protein (TIGR01671 family)